MFQSLDSYVSEDTIYNVKFYFVLFVLTLTVFLTIVALIRKHFEEDDVVQTHYLNMKDGISRTISRRYSKYEEDEDDDEDVFFDLDSPKLITEILAIEDKDVIYDKEKCENVYLVKFKGPEKYHEIYYETDYETFVSTRKKAMKYKILFTEYQDEIWSEFLCYDGCIEAYSLK